MNWIKNFSIALIIAFTFSATAAADSKTYTGTGTLQRDDLTLALGNGQTVFTARSQGLATLSTQPPVMVLVRCLGMGVFLDDNNFNTDVYCRFQENDEDGFDVKAVSVPAGGTLTVIGGSGKWASATGSGTFERMEASDTHVRFSYELDIAVP